MSDETEDRIRAVADAILALTYSEMMSIAQELAGMQAELDRDLTDASSWADMLSSWADSQEA